MAAVVIWWMLIAGAVARAAESACDVTAFGAKGDGVSYDTQAIQQAIDSCAAHCHAQLKQKQAAAAEEEEEEEEEEEVEAEEERQRERPQMPDACRNMSVVTLPAPGRYLTGTLFLRSGTLLHISPGATLLASPLQDHYPSLHSRWYLLLAENASNVGITGSDIHMMGSEISIMRSDTERKELGTDIISSEANIMGAAAYSDATAFDAGSKAGIAADRGVIDGQSSLFVQSFNSIKNVMVSWNQTGACYGDECRPRLIGFLDCRHVRIWNIQLYQPAYWCVHIVRSDGVSIHDVSIVGDFNTPNNDGIDIDSSNNTLIHSCDINTGDDAICPKTTYGPVYNLTVYGCWIRTKSCAVKLGSASSYDFVGLYFNDIQVVESHRGIGLQLRDSGNISDLLFSNFNITTQYYDSSWWGRAEPIYITSCPRTSATAVGSITNVRFVNITAVSENGIFLSGLGGGMLTDIRLDNINLYLSRFTNYTGGLSDYRPGCQGLVKHQNAGVFIENVSSLILDNVHVYLAPNVENLISPMELIPGTTAGSMHFENFSLFLQTSLDNMKLR